MEVEPTPEIPLTHGLTQTQKMALLALAGLSVVAVGLSVIVARRRRPESQDTIDILDSDSWQDSLRHLAGAWDYRFRGQAEELERIKRHIGMETGPVVTTTIPNVETPGPNGITGNPPVGGIPVANQVAPAGADDVIPPPGPASVSM